MNTLERARYRLRRGIDRCVLSFSVHFVWTDVTFRREKQLRMTAKYAADRLCKRVGRRWHASGKIGGGGRWVRKREREGEIHWFWKDLKDTSPQSCDSKSWLLVREVEPLPQLARSASIFLWIGSSGLSQDTSHLEGGATVTQHFIVAAVH